MVSFGSSFSYLTSAAVNLLMKTGMPPHTIYMTSPGGRSPTLVYKYSGCTPSLGMYLYHISSIH